MSAKVPDQYDCADEVEKAYDADVYLYSGPIDDSGFGELVRAITTAGIKHDKCLLLLTTNGGSANSAYQIARFIQKQYSKFILFTPSYCKSAGTLIALGAHQLIMDEFSELGPLDIQLPSPDDIVGQKSGLLAKAAFENLAEVTTEFYEHFLIRIKARSGNKVSFRLASEISTALTTQLLPKVFEQINPDVLGSDFRDLNVATEYGGRLAQKSGNPKRSTVNDLVRKYPSHDFIIDNDEAGSLFNSVVKPQQCLYQLIGTLGPAPYQEQRRALVVRIRRPDSPKPEETVSEDKRKEAGPDEGNGRTEPSVDDRGSRDQRSDQGQGNSQQVGGKVPESARKSRKRGTSSTRSRTI
jgi:Serine dehydrogenase proteinase